MKSITSHSLEETDQIAADWLAKMAHERADKVADEATVVGLSGHLGAGKTAFAKAVAQELGISENITSPTFVLMKIYEIPADSQTSSAGGSASTFPWKRLVHIDAYRLERTDELDALEWEELVADAGNLIIVEWPGNVELAGQEIGGYTEIRFEIREGNHQIAFV